MKRRGHAPVAAMVVAALLAPAGSARADDGGADARTLIRAPLEAAACEQTPRVIRVLGLPIDVSGARFGAEGKGEPGEEGALEDDAAAAGCESLVTDRTVEVTLRGDSAPLSAAEVVQEDVEEEIRIRAPIEAVSEDLQTITLLGLRIDTSSVPLEAAGEGETDADDAGSEPARRLIGKFVEADLDPGSLPWLVAAGLEFEGGDEEAGDAEEQEEIGWFLPAGGGTVFEFVEVFTPAFIGRTPKHAVGSRPPHFRRSPHRPPSGTVGPPAMRVGPAPGLAGTGPSR